jgi:5'-nucleotidase
MKILITNDDGINADGIRHLVEFAKTKGEVVVCAPKYEQSAKSHAIEIRNEFEIKPVDIFEGVRAYSVDSTPADCVRYAVLGLKESFDVVLSGINKGPNLGLDLVYSATLGAVFEASRLGLCGIAFSTDFDSFENAKSSLETVYREFEKRSLLTINPIYNVNIPSDKTLGIRYTRQGHIYYDDEFVPTGRDNMFRQDGHCVYAGGNNLDEDIDAFRCGYVSITPLAKSRTETAVLKELKKG